jgi:hypothetical protein
VHEDPGRQAAWQLGPADPRTVGVERGGGHGRSVAPDRGAGSRLGKSQTLKKG